MTNAREWTLKGPVEWVGTGLHTGKDVRLRLDPAPEGHGIAFRRSDLPGSPPVPADIAHISTQARRTALRAGAAVVHTVEHLLAALWGAGVDNAVAAVNGEELPGLDGSALPFYEAIARVGRVEQAAPRKTIRLAAPVTVQEGGTTLVAIPAEGSMAVSYTLNAVRDWMTPQHLTVAIDEERFVREIAPARTWVIEDEVDGLLRAGLGKGADFRNTLVVGPAGARENRFRFPDELVRHKILDLIGDLVLLGRRLEAHVVAVGSGHHANARLVSRILESETGLPGGFGIEEIQEVIPHRYPFLLLDRVLEIEGSKRAVGIKCVTHDEPFFQGHFPGQPVMPGVLQVEAMAQLACFLLLHGTEEAAQIPFLLAIEKAKFRKPVRAGDTLVMEVETGRVGSRAGNAKAVARVDGKVVAEAVITFMFVDREKR